MNNKTKQSEKTAKWYIDKVLAAAVPVFVIAAVIIIALGYEQSDALSAAGFLMFPLISILISPNAAMYALKDMKDWKKIFYGKGNLEKFKDSKDFYSVKTPLSFEKKILRTVIKGQILDVLTVIAVLFIGSVAGVLIMVFHESRVVAPGDLIGAILHVKMQRRIGSAFFILLAIAVLGLPVFVYYVTNAVYRIRIVTAHKYMAYHAIVKHINKYVIRIDRDGRHYKYDYSTLVGMKEDQICDTPAILVFIPDDVLVFPDKSD